MRLHSQTALDPSRDCEYVADVPLDGAGESNLTRGTEWPYKATNETYKSGTELIALLVKTRAIDGCLPH